MITSSSNARVKQVVQWQSKAKERRRDRVFLAEGVKMYAEAPQQDIVEVYLSQDMEKRVQELVPIWQKLCVTGYETVSSEVFAKMSDTQTPQGILTVLRQKEYCLKELIAHANPLLIVLEDLQDPGNLGTIVRTGEGAGISGIIMSRQTVDIYNPKTIRATMGSIYRVPFVYVQDLAKVIDHLRKNKIYTYAAHLKGENNYYHLSFRDAAAFLIGNEGRGLSAEISAMADYLLRIPMEGQVESLNAAVAASLLVYEAYRQRCL